MKRTAFSLLVGIALGVVYFFAVHPILVGTSYRMILERESALALAFRGLPVLAVVISLYVGLFASHSKRQAFLVGAATAIGCLLPLPLGQYVVEAPRLFGMPRTSAAMLGDEAVALIGLLVAAAILAGIAAIVSPPLGRVLGRRLRRSHT